ncbi:hypothetical protein [Dactylosporangium sp. NPDC051541]
MVRSESFTKTLGDRRIKATAAAFTSDEVDVVVRLLCRIDNGGGAQTG